MCQYYKNGICEYLTEAVDKNGFHVTMGFCATACREGVNKHVFANRKTQPKPNNKEGCSSCGKVKNIVKGLSKLIWVRIADKKPSDETIRRSEICSQCEYRTFLNIAKWGLDYVRGKNLPIIHEPGKYDALWCSKCGCCIEAKILVADEKCPIDKWSNNND